MKRRQEQQEQLARQSSLKQQSRRERSDSLSDSDDAAPVAPSDIADADAAAVDADADGGDHGSKLSVDLARGLSELRVRATSVICDV